MAVHIAFEKSADTLLKKLVKMIAGPYVHTELIISQPSSPGQATVHTAYSAYMAETFSRTFQKDFWFDDEHHDFLFIPMSQEELYRLSKACEACVESKIPYNTLDMVFSQVPLRNPQEKDLYSSKALFCSQAAVLMLRSSLDSNHELQDPLAAINSRTVSPSYLYEILKPYCVPRQKYEVLK